MRPAWVIVLALTTTIGTDARATTGREVPLFTIAKSENKNLVQYTVRVDDTCKPTPGAPVYAYWRMLEVGPTRTAPLLAREVRAYGLSSQQIVSPATTAAVGTVRIVLAAVPDRPLLIDTFRSNDGTCRALSTVRIAGAPAHLFDVYVRLHLPFGVEYMLLQGWSIDGTHRVEEKIAG